MDVAYVRHPEFLDIKIATELMIRTYLDPCVEFVSSNPHFDNWELQKLNRILEDCNARFKSTQSKDDVSINRYRFTQFIKQYDQRRKKNFLNNFPEYQDFWDLCMKS